MICFNPTGNCHRFINLFLYLFLYYHITYLVYFNLIFNLIFNFTFIIFGVIIQGTGILKIKLE
jgi:hypothetical protein